MGSIDADYLEENDASLWRYTAKDTYEGWDPCGFHEDETTESAYCIDFDVDDRRSTAGGGAW